MKKKWVKRGFAVSLLLGILSIAFFASAEENGYWTMKTDESGNSVMIYTYTKPVDWVVAEDEGYGQCGTQPAQTDQTAQAAQPTQAIAAVQEADVHMAADAPAVQTVGTVRTKADAAVRPLAVSAVGAAGGIAAGFLFIKHRQRRILQEVRTGSSASGK